MVWIPVDQSLPTHRKTLHVAALLKIPRAQVVGHMVILWAWSVDNTRDGALPREAALIAEAAGWSGDAQAWTQALLTAGFLDDNQAAYIIHNWSEHIGRLIARREHNRLAMQESRVKHVDNTSPTRDYIEKSREEKSREEETPLPPVVSPPPPTPPLETGGVPPQAGDTLSARENADLPPEKPKPLVRRTKTVKTLSAPNVSEDFIVRMVTQYAESWPAESVRERITLALDHKAARSYTNWELYVQGWLRRDLQREARNGSKPNFDRERTALPSGESSALAKY